MLKWTTVSGATGYIIDIVAGGKAVPTITVLSTVSSLDLADYGVDYYAGMNVTVTIRAKGDGNRVITSAATTGVWPR